MNMPKVIRTYCSKCKKHTEHSVSLYKKGTERSLAQGTRRYERKQKGYGGQTKPKLRRTAKTTKRQELKLKCNVCGYVVERQGVRLRKLVIAS